MRGTATEVRPGVWRLRVYVTRHPVSGKPGQVSKTVHTKKRGAKKEALDALADFYEEVESGGLRSRNAAHTLKRLMAEYVDLRRNGGAKRSTVETYEHAIKRVPEDLAAKLVADVTVHDLDTLLSDLGATLSPSTIHFTHAFLHACLKQAVRWEWIATNPADISRPPKQAKVERKPFPPADAYKMIQRAVAAREDGGAGDIVLATAILLSSLTGARRGELCGLRWEDVDIDAGTVRIERQFVPGKGGQYQDTTKSGAGSIPLGELGMALLEDYRAVMRAFLEREPDGWLLTYDGVKPLRAKALGASITALAKKCGLTATTHSFRRVSATELVAAGVDVDTGARRMRHTRTVMLDAYVLGADDKQAAAAEALEARLVERGLPLAGILTPPPKETS